MVVGCKFKDVSHPMPFVHSKLISCTLVISAVPKQKSGSVTFPASLLPDTRGVYELRYHIGGSYDCIAATPFCISPETSVNHSRRASTASSASSADALADAASSKASGS